MKNNHCGRNECMIKFIDDNICNIQPDNSIITLDCNLQGVWEFHELDLIKYAFPETYKHYLSLCINKKVKLGQTILAKEHNYDLALMFVKDKYIQTDENIVIPNLEKALIELIQIAPEGKQFCSPLMGRMDKLFPKMFSKLNQVVRNKELTWFIYRKKDL